MAKKVPKNKEVSVPTIRLFALKDSNNNDVLLDGRWEKKIAAKAYRDEMNETVMTKEDGTPVIRYQVTRAEDHRHGVSLPSSYRQPPRAVSKRKKAYAE